MGCDLEGGREGAGMCMLGVCRCPYSSPEHLGGQTCVWLSARGHPSRPSSHPSVLRLNKGYGPAAIALLNICSHGGFCAPVCEVASVVFDSL